MNTYITTLPLSGAILCILELMIMRIIKKKNICMCIYILKKFCLTMQKTMVLFGECACVGGSFFFFFCQHCTAWRERVCPALCSTQGRSVCVRPLRMRGGRSAQSPLSTYLSAPQPQ